MVNYIRKFPSPDSAFDQTVAKCWWCRRVWLWQPIAGCQETELASMRCLSQLRLMVASFASARSVPPNILPFQGDLPEVEHVDLTEDVVDWQAALQESSRIATCFFKGAGQLLATTLGGRDVFFTAS